MRNSNVLSNIERQEQLVDMLNRLGRLSIAQICDAFSISEATARRDLDALATQGQLQRFHGGALLSRRATAEAPLLQRAQEQADAKDRIGRAAAALVKEGETVFLGSGTTVLQVAHHLSSRRITVVTNSLPVINLIVNAPDITLITLGGKLRLSEMSFIGQITEQALAGVDVDRVILGTRAIDLQQGLTNDYLPETLTDRAILAAGREVIVVADHSKCGSVSTAFLAPLSAMQFLVTDTGTPQEFVAALQAQGIRVVQA